METAAQLVGRPLVCRAANQAARAVVKVIEEQTGQEVNIYNSVRLVQCIGAALEQNGMFGGPPGEIRAILEKPFAPCAPAAPDWADDGTPTDEQRGRDVDQYNRWLASRVQRDMLPDRSYVWNAACAYARRLAAASPSAKPKEAE